MIPSNLPLCVTRVCLRPSFLNISTTVSIGVWSVIVMGARSTIFLSLIGGGPLPTTGTCWVKTHREDPGKDSRRALALSVASNRSRLNTKPTRYWDSLQVTNQIKTRCFSWQLPGHYHGESIVVCWLHDLLKLSNCCGILLEGVDGMITEGGSNSYYLSYHC